MRTLQIIVPLAAALLGACGTEDKPPAPGGDLYPLAVGDAWLYEETDGADVTQNQHEVIDRIERDFAYDDTDALPVFVVEDTFPTGESSDTDVAPGGWRLEYVHDDGTRVARLRQDVYDDTGALTKTRDYAPGFLRLDRGRIEVGDQWAEEYTRYSDTLDGSAVTQEVVSYLYEVMAPETATVPAGTFDCTVIQRTETIGSSPEIKRYYFAAGVGKVREVTGGKVEELVSYHLAGSPDAGL